MSALQTKTAPRNRQAPRGCCYVWPFWTGRLTSPVPSACRRSGLPEGLRGEAVVLPPRDQRGNGGDTGGDQLLHGLALDGQHGLIAVLFPHGTRRSTRRPPHGTVCRARTCRFRFWRPALFQHELKRHEKSTGQILHSALNGRGKTLFLGVRVHRGYGLLFLVQIHIQICIRVTVCLFRPLSVFFC